MGQRNDSGKSDFAAGQENLREEAVERSENAIQGRSEKTPSPRRSFRRSLNAALTGALEAPLSVLAAFGALVLLWVVGLRVGALYRIQAMQAPSMEEALKALAILVGGLWTFYHFALKRSFGTAMKLGISVTTTPSDVPELCMAQMEIVLTNTGSRRIIAAEMLDDATKKDLENSVKYPGDLQVRRVPSTVHPGSEGHLIGWWGAGLVPVNPEHVDYLFEYTRSDKKCDFFMEPCEEYRLGVTYRLPPGDYLAKVVFVGARLNSSEFWSRIVGFRVPSLGEAPRAASTSPAPTTPGSPGSE